MIESPVLQRFLAEQLANVTQKTIQRFLQARFGPVPSEIVAGLQQVTDLDCLDELVKRAATCSDFDGFRQHLPPLAQGQRVGV